MSFINNNYTPREFEAKRRLLLQKDFLELQQWMDTVEYIHEELNVFGMIEKQLIIKTAIASNIQALRRKNTLVLSNLCKYEQQLKNELEYGKNDYDHIRSKDHERQQAFFKNHILDYRKLKKNIYILMLQFKRK
ncbi:hypothetical protein NO995_13675 [Aestuariibaculum sp. M13]|uniref:hypothetical protein n=1 Tax=Aestuariibaculum sp. M13 TaxID=2967132 RepID=UPI002159DB58|nr:hypothetical protein [Aestuariibaculum sp. M13]MCR8668737.1 hypothetical protein [Aestuariibaculum sp. M13]